MRSVDKPYLYSLIANQLLADGNYIAASDFSRLTMTPHRLVGEIDQGVDADLETIVGKAVNPKSQTLFSADTRDQQLHQQEPGPSQHQAANINQTFRKFFEARHKEQATFVKFSSDGHQLISGGTDNCLKHVNISSAKQFCREQETSLRKEKGNMKRTTFYGHAGTIVDADFHPYARLIVSASRDSTAKLYVTSKMDVSSGDLLATFFTGSPLRSVAWHPCGSYVGVSWDSSPSIGLIDITRGDMDIVKLTGPAPGIQGIDKVHFTSDSSLLIGQHTKGLSFFDPRTGIFKADRNYMSAATWNSGPEQMHTTGFHMFQDNNRILVSTTLGTALLDMRKLGPMAQNYPHIRTHPTTMAFDSLVLGLDHNQRARVVCYSADDSSICRRDLTDSFNISFIAGSPTEACFGYIFDRTFYLYDNMTSNQPRMSHDTNYYDGNY